jgi:hypothetical protein
LTDTKKYIQEKRIRGIEYEKEDLIYQLHIPPTREHNLCR